ncbi:hypothetical protein PanWU01x14_082840 [Parasponia andersonii]|uniref:Uncharacterized protein n=1 Tax=Parasponia andersonii TaxID=3476 RepID=A0A2P5DA04_PARAD|nr:hypothetical protein PanWU01x14_082840 [Parasponia andersonii]
MEMARSGQVKQSPSTNPPSELLICCHVLHPEVAPEPPPLLLPFPKSTTSGNGQTPLPYPNPISSNPFPSPSPNPPSAKNPPGA